MKGVGPAGGSPASTLAEKVKEGATLANTALGAKAEANRISDGANASRLSGAKTNADTTERIVSGSAQSGTLILQKQVNGVDIGKHDTIRYEKKKQ